MHIVMVASECAPVAKVGGLADVVYGLSRELEIQGHKVDILLPKYDCLRYDHVWGLTPCYNDLWVPWNGKSIRCTVWFGHVHGRRCHFIEPHSPENFFSRGTFYGFPDEALRFAFFSRAVLEYLYKSGMRPDIIHTHDWQSALVPVLLFEIYQSLGMDRQRVCHTIHNFKHQGIAGANMLVAAGLTDTPRYFARERLGDDFNPTAVNLTKGAIVYANFVTTVSPSHAWETRHSDQGQGLGHVLHLYQSKYGGVLNGLDYDMWNPANDNHIPHPFSVEHPEDKTADTQALRQRFMLREVDRPVVAYVGRLDPQKGVHLIRHALFYSIWNDAQFVLLGSSPEDGINQEFWRLKSHLNDNPDSHLEIGFSEELAHMIYAGADMIVVPSLFEPCGLTQMIGLRYGAVPVVRRVGGLADTVFDWDYSDKPQEERNGFTFEHPDYGGVESALSRAFGLWRDRRDLFTRLRLQGMAQDYSWTRPATHYSNIYDFIRAK
ncbi:MAG: glycogen synthase [Magnetococcus sp. WYHC-3]